MVTFLSRERKVTKISLAFLAVFQTHKYLEGKDGGLGLHYLLLVPLAFLALGRKKPWLGLLAYAKARPEWFWAGVGATAAISTAAISFRNSREAPVLTEASSSAATAASVGGAASAAAMVRASAVESAGGAVAAALEIRGFVGAEQSWDRLLSTMGN